MKINDFKDLLISTILTCFVTASYLTGIETVQFHGDEAEWIGSSQSFEAFFTAHFDSSYFNESYWTLTQPPLARYFIGIGRRIGGYRGDDRFFQTMWGMGYDASTVPSENLLWWSRLPMALLAIISIMIGFGLIRESSGQIAGWIWLVLSINSSYLLLHLRRAMGESALLVSVVLVMFMCYRVLGLLTIGKSSRSWKLFLWLSGLGAVAGAAGAAKLNGLSVVVAGVILATIVTLKFEGSAFKKLLFGFFATLTVILFSLFTFIGLNPFLWPHPVGRTQAMFEHRTKGMIDQQRVYAELQIESLRKTVKVVPFRIFKTYGATGFFAVNIVLFVAGLYSIVNKSWKAISKGIIYPAPIALILVGFASAIPPLYTPLDFDRYYLLPVFFTTLLMAIGAGAVGKKAYQISKAAYEHTLPKIRLNPLAGVNTRPTMRQTVSKVDFSKIRSNKINGLQSPHAPKTEF